MFKATLLEVYCHCVAGSGHYIEMAKTDKAAGKKARLISPYMNTTDRCLELYYWIRAADNHADRDRNRTQLSLIAVSEDLNETTLASVTASTVDFIRLFVTLPTGLHRLVIEGRRDSLKLQCSISIDDIAVMGCKRFGMFMIFSYKSVH